MIKNNSIMKCCICNNEKMGEFITINDKKYHLCCIEQLKKQKDDVVEYIKYQLSNLDFKKDEDMKAKMLGSMILVMLEDKRMLGEIDDK